MYLTTSYPMPIPPPSPSVSLAPPDLTEREVLLLDCQTTGASPARGHLLEVAWAPFRGRDEATPRVESVLVALPEGARVPARVTALTGIGDGDLAGAVSAAEAWRRLRAAAEGRPVVLHYARFERSFLEALHAELDPPEEPFPLDLVCTHEIACRLLPDLPRRGLRAVAGRIGHVLGELKRAAEHVRATAVVWSDLTARLVSDEQVRTFAELTAWTRSTKPTRRGGRDFAVERDVRLDLPDAPGVYRMLGRGGEVLYVGKATSLKRRVNGYFQKRRHDRTHVPEMLTQTWAVEPTPTATVLEAALLEVDEIQELAPPYNKALRLRDRQVGFADPALTSCRPHPDAAYPVGPLTRPASVDALAAWRRLLGGDDVVSEADGRMALGLVDAAALDPTVLSGGLALVRAGGGAVAVHSLPGLLRVGGRLWRAWLAERDAARAAAREETAEADQAAEEQEEAQTREGPWTPETPEAVQRVFEGVVSDVAHQVRRARALIALSEASLVWHPPMGASRPPRLLVVERGRVVRAEDAAGGEAPAPPPGWPRTPQRRQDVLDVAACDRLRVLLSEIRRLVVDGRLVELCLGPPSRTMSSRTLPSRLRGAALARRLRWL